MKKQLFLDDERFPARIYKDYDAWTTVRSYKEFTEEIEKNGLPKVISFDHDLSVEHYCYTSTIIPDGMGGLIYNPFYISGSNYEEIPYDKFREKTGLDCAKFLVNYCMEKNQKLPIWKIHSANPAGAENIRSYLKSYEKSLTI